MTKADRKFILAVMIFQTGIIAACVLWSGKYWHDSVFGSLEIMELKKQKSFYEGEINRLDADKKIDALKNNFRKKGIGAN